MEKMQFSTTINATAERTWEILWGDTSYPAWTAVFTDGSRAETDWQKGSKVLFLDGKNDGMVCVIEEKIPNKFMSFRYSGIVKKGVEDYESAAVKEFAGGTENYTLTETDGKTELLVEMKGGGDMKQEMKDYFTGTFPKALDKVKELAEN